MNRKPKEPNVKAEACSYILVMLLQRLEVKHPELMEEMNSGVSADQSAIESTGQMNGHAQKVCEEAQRILAQAKSR